MSKPEIRLQEQELDRLVDGELCDADRRELIRRIESAEDGWRRCALAFLEAQEWTRALAPLTKRDAVTLTSELAPAPGRPRWRRVGLLIAVAGVVLLAFAGGWAGGRSSVPIVVQADRIAPAEAHESAANVLQPDAPQTNTAALSDEDEPVDAAASDSTPGVQVVGLMRIAGDARAQQNFAVPVFAVTGDDIQWQEQLPSPYSDAELRRLRRDGYRVNRPLMRVDLADGSRLAIPLGTVQLQYVGAEIH